MQMPLKLVENRLAGLTLKQTQKQIQKIIGEI
jgi:hypothetical protein